MQGEDYEHRIDHSYIEMNSVSTIIGKLESSGAVVYHETLGTDSLDEAATGFGSGLGRE